MVYVEEVAALVTAMWVVVAVPQMAWSLAEAALVVVDRPLIAELRVIADLRLVCLRAVLHPLVSLQLVVSLLPGLKVLGSRFWSVQRSRRHTGR